MIFRSHLLSMTVYAFFVSIVLSLIRRDDPLSRFRYGLKLFLIMVVGALTFGWLMYFFGR